MEVVSLLRNQVVILNWNQVVTLNWNWVVNITGICKYKTELIFNLDILEAVLISFENSNSDYNELSEIVNLKLNCLCETLENSEVKICRFVTKSNEVWILKTKSNLYVLVCNNKYSINIISTLL